VPTFDVNIEGKTYHIDIPDPKASPLKVIVDGQAFEVTLEGNPEVTEQLAALETPAMPAPSLRPTRAAAQAATVRGEIRAPMPGTILSIQVNPGATVKEGDVLCVLEAMKMKNPIRATRNGTVSEIAIEQGQNVSHGQLLARLE
jgi:biotin carboxyl carrier protein